MGLELASISRPEMDLESMPMWDTTINTFPKVLAPSPTVPAPLGTKRHLTTRKLNLSLGKPPLMLTKGNESR